ncbi:cytochrome P450 [Nannocystaceae bacterium ST9]
MPLEVDFFSPDFQADPFPHYARMREAGLSRIAPMGFYALSRHADVRQALRNSEQFSSAGFVEAFEPPWVGYNPAAHTMLSMDPPEHTHARALVNRAFAGPALARVEPILRTLVGALVDALAERGEADIVESFALPLTGGMLGHFLDLDPALHARFKHWSDCIVGITPTPRDEAHVAEVAAAIADLQLTLGALLDQRRLQLGDDLTSALLRAEVEGHGLDQRELICFLLMLIVAGLENTTNLITKATLHLAAQPELHGRLRAEPGLIPRFIEEMLRWDPPAHTLFRVTRSDVEIAGGTIPAGSFVMLMLAAANRDAAVFPDPDRFVLERETSGHVAFGHGPHLCIGLALARLETRLAFEALTQRFQRIEATDAVGPWLHTMTVRGPARAVVRLIT